ncbi:MAG: DoxX family membrane protein [Anaerolineales bacterium]|nr:DoxX family membrane protein [Anaerolineales bacterium]
MAALTQWLIRVDVALTRWMARYGVSGLRVSLGIVFFWFGVLKFFPGLSPAQDLAARTIETLSFGWVPPAVSVPVLAAWECLIGLGLITGRFMRATLLLLILQMLGTVTPLALFPAETFTRFPYAPTLEGQYIIKNVVLVSAAVVLGATVRGGDLVADPELARRPAG